MHALQVNVGRLGIVTEVELSIIPQDMVARTVTATDIWGFVDAMKTLEVDYKAALSGTGPRTVAQVLSEYEGTQVRVKVLKQRPPSV